MIRFQNVFFWMGLWAYHIQYTLCSIEPKNWEGIQHSQMNLQENFCFFFFFILKKTRFYHKDPYLTLLDRRNTPTKGLDSSPVQRLIEQRTETPSQPRQDYWNPNFLSPLRNSYQRKERNKQNYHFRGANWNNLKDLKQGDMIVRMKLDPRNSWMQWKKATCLEEVVPRS